MERLREFFEKTEYLVIRLLLLVLLLICVYRILDSELNLRELISVTVFR